MTYRIVDGDYAPSPQGTDLQTIDYMDAMIQGIRMRLVAQRGRFYPNKDFGSRLGDRLDDPVDEYALALARQALEGLDGVFVQSARIVTGTIILELTINSVKKQVIQDIEGYI